MREERVPRSKCARTFSASSPSSELEWVLPAARPSSVKYVKNLPALDFHLSREIVDTNLTHPPLFKICAQAVSRS